MTLGKGINPFETAEFLRRLGNVRTEMAQQGVEVLLVSDAANITYLSGYIADSAYVPQVLVVDAVNDEPVLVVRKMDAPAGFHTSFLSRDRVLGYPESLIGNSEADGYDYVLSYLDTAFRPSAIVAAEKSALLYRAVTKLERRLGSRLRDFSTQIGRIRLVKSDSEIAVMQQAAAIADSAIMRAVEVIRPGVRECEAAGEILKVQAAGPPLFGGTHVVPPLISSTPRIGTPHIYWSDGRFEQGMQVNMEIVGCRYLYAAGIMRVISLGTPSGRLQRLHEAELEGMISALDAAKPGATCADVAHAFHRVLRKHGFHKESRCGYSIGINFLETSASIQAGDQTVLEPNMTFHLMLGNWVDDDFGYTFSESFRVTQTGAASLSKVPRQLFVTN